MLSADLECLQRERARKRILIVSFPRMANNDIVNQINGAHTENNRGGGLKTVNYSFKNTTIK